MSADRTIDGRDVPLAGTWTFDHHHSDLVMTARHLMVTKVRGTFPEFDGSIVVGEDPRDSSVRYEAKAGSITTGSADRDAHLRSPDFLDADNHPLVTFESTSVEPEGDHWRLEGTLSVRGVSRPVTFDLYYDGSMIDPYGQTKAGFRVVGEVEREDWGLTWNVPLEGGGVLVGRSIRFEFDVEAQLQA